MCTGPSKSSPPRFSRRQRLQTRRALLPKTLKEKKMKALKQEIKLKNLKLYLKNKSIIEENEKLRKKAVLLHQENQALLSLLQHKFADPLV